MNLNTLPKITKKTKKRLGLGHGSGRGKTAGRGTKGQKSRAGHKIRPAERDLLIRFPKLRGFRNKPLSDKKDVLNLDDLQKSKETVFNKKNVGHVKILAGGELKKAVTIDGLKISKSAKAAVEKAGGQVN